MKRKFLAVVLLLTSSFTFAGTCGNGYLKRKLLVVPHQQLSSSVTGVVKEFCFNGACARNNIVLKDVKTAANGGQIQHLDSGLPADFILCDAPSAGNALPFEIDPDYSASTGKMAVYLKGDWSASTDNWVWAFYNNSSVTTSQQSVATTWSRYTAVYHFGTSSSLSLADSTGNGHTLTNSSVTAVAGMFGGAASFNGSAKFTTALLNSTGTNWTVEIWHKTPNTSGQAANLFSDGTQGSNGFALAQVTSGCGSDVVDAMVWTAITCNGAGGNTGLIPPYDYSYVVSTRDTTTAKLYQEGVLKSSSSSGGPNTPTGSTYIGGCSSGCGIVGTIDEVRYAASVFTAAEIAAAADNNFVMIDAPIITGVSSGTPYCIPVNIDPAMVSTATQTNFPYLYHAYSEAFATTGNGGLGANVNGYDLRWFSDSACSAAITFDRVYWSATPAPMAFRVLVPSVSNSVTTTIYLGIGDSSYTSDASNPAGVWSGYKSVYELGSPTSLSLSDAGAAGLTLSACGTGAGVGPIQTPLGGGAYVPDTTSCLNTASDPCLVSGYPCGSAVVTFTVWMRDGVLINPVNCAGSGCTAAGFGKANSGTAGAAHEFSFGRYANAVACVGHSSNGLTCASNGNTAITSAQYPTATYGAPAVGADRSWHRYDFVQSSAGANMAASAVYIDGALLSAGASLLYETNASGADVFSGAALSSEFNIGRDAAHGLGWCPSCQVAAPRVIASALSAGRIQTEFNSESAPWEYTSLGTPAPVGPTSSTPRRRSQVY